MQPCCQDASLRLEQSSDASFAIPEYLLPERHNQALHRLPVPHQLRSLLRPLQHHRLQLHQVQHYPRQRCQPPRNHGLNHNLGTAHWQSPFHPTRRTRRRSLPPSEPFLVVASESSPIAWTILPQIHREPPRSLRSMVVFALLGIRPTNPQANSLAHHPIPYSPMTDTTLARIIPKNSPAVSQLL